MNRKVLPKAVVLTIIGFLFIVGIGYVVVNRQASVDSQKENSITTEKVPSKTTKTYTDDSGFSFDYPDDVVVNKKDVNESTYANLELTSPQAVGNITFTVEDTTLKSATSEATAKDVSLGSLLAKEFTSNEKIETVALDQGILFRLEVAFGKEKTYWLDVYNTIVSSFAFVLPPSSAGDVGSSTEGDEVILEEEIVE